MPSPKPIYELADSTRKQELGRLKARHELIMRMLLAGHTSKDIAETVHMSQSRLSRVINSPLFQLAYIGYQDKLRNLTIDKVAADPVREAVTGSQEKAIKKVLEIMDDENAPKKTQLDAAKHILDLGGHNVKQEVNLTTGVNVTLKEVTYEDEDADRGDRDTNTI